MIDALLIKFRNQKESIQMLLVSLTFVLIYFLILIANQMFNSQATGIEQFLTKEFASFVLIGFAAQLVDGALGMAYGVCSSTLLISTGLTPGAASASVHFAEVFTTGASGISHLSLRNVNKKLFKALVIPGCIGAIIGASFASLYNSPYLKPVVSVYLLIMGLLIIKKALKKVIAKKKIERAGWLAFFGGFMDSAGGGGWGPIVTSNLLSKGRDPQFSIGTVSATEFFVSLASAGTFFTFTGIQHFNIVCGLILGGIIAAPCSAYLVRKFSAKAMMLTVGTLIVILSLRNIL